MSCDTLFWNLMTTYLIFFHEYEIRSVKYKRLSYILDNACILQAHILFNLQQRKIEKKKNNNNNKKNISLLDMFPTLSFILPASPPSFPKNATKMSIVMMKITNKVKNGK